MPKYSVVMPVFLKDSDHKIIVEQTIESIKQNSEDFEFIIIDDGSTLPTGFLKEAADTYIRHNGGNKGIAPSWNDGLSIARGEYVVIINDDILVLPKWLELMSSTLNIYEQAGVVGPMIAGPNITPQMIDKDSYEDYRFFPGYCFMFKRDRWFEKFDEQFTPFNFEDTDMWWCIMKAGLKLYRAPLAIWHKEGDTIHKMEYGRINTENHKKFINKWGFDPQPYFYGNEDIKNAFSL